MATLEWSWLNHVDKDVICLRKLLPDPRFTYQYLEITREDLPELIEAIDQAFGVDLVDNNLRDHKD